MEYHVASGQSEFVSRLFMSPPTVCQILHSVKPTLQNPLSFYSYLVCGTLFSNNSKHSSSRFLQALLSSSSTQHYTSLFVKHFEVLCLREHQFAYSFFACLHILSLLVVSFKELCVREHPNTSLHIRPQALLGRPPSNWY